MTDIVPLFLTEPQISQRIMGVGRLHHWKALAPILERDGFPKIDERFGGRYWPACELWFKGRYGVAKIAPGQLGPQDGAETCIPITRKRRDSSTESGATVHKLHTGSQDAS